MNTSDIATKLAADHALPKNKVKQLIDSTFEVITQAAAQGEEISLPGFGKFKIQNRPEREGRNPATGETVTLAASKVLKFQPAKAVKDQLAGSAS